MLFKPGQLPGYEWTKRWDNSITDPIQTWASPEVKIIRISEGFSQKGIEFRVRQFVPLKEDKLERTWNFKGRKVAVKVPPYALIDMNEGKEAYKKYIKEVIGDAFRTVLGSSGDILYKTYRQTCLMTRDRSQSTEILELIGWTLRLWMSIRLSTRSAFIVGQERLGMADDILDETSPNPGQIPIPPVFGAQLDVILIHHIQAELRRELLERLQRIILKNKHENWLVIYLVIFVLLHNISLIIAHDASYATKHGILVSFSFLSQLGLIQNVCFY